MNCPMCGRPVYVWFSLQRMQAVCACENAQCELCRRQVEGTGETTKEAREHFSGLAQGFEIKLRRAAR